MAKAREIEIKYKTRIDQQKQKIEEHTRELHALVHEYNSNPHVKLHKRSMAYRREVSAQKAARSNQDPY